MGQNLSEFELHLRAVLGLPIPTIRSLGPAASRVILASQTAEAVVFEGVAEALLEPETQVLLFGKADARPYRRMGVALAQGATETEARRKADAAAQHIGPRAAGHNHIIGRDKTQIFPPKDTILSSTKSKSQLNMPITMA
jgi:phosphoribosylglycinamide formyltransferase 2